MNFFNLGAPKLNFLSLYKTYEFISQKTVHRINQSLQSIKYYRTKWPWFPFKIKMIPLRLIGRWCYNSRHMRALGDPVAAGCKTISSWLLGCASLAISSMAGHGWMDGHGSFFTSRSFAFYGFLITVHLSFCVSVSLFLSAMLNQSYCWIWMASSFRENPR